MILTNELLVDISESVNSPHRKEKRVEDYKRWLMFNGSTEEIIRDAIRKEYGDPTGESALTIDELCGRLIPINFVNKIITKLAGVYTESPLRQVLDQNKTDQELLEEYVDEMNLNMRMKEANRYFKLFKRNLSEIYVDDLGYPCIRNLPRHTYEVFSFSGLTPNRPDVIVKIIQDNNEIEKQVLAVWTNESHVLINGKGDVMVDAMVSMENTDGVNPYEVLPFIYINESSYSVDPISDDDLMRMSIAIPIILTDICWATKYQSNSIIYTIGYEGKIPTAPNAGFNMPIGPDGERPEVNQIKPEVDTDKVITMVQTLVALLLSTKSLSVNTVQTKLDASNAASGISKMLDSAESVEDKKDQQSYFEKAEKQLWQLLKKNLIPQWRRQNKLISKLNKDFTEAFDIDLYFMEPKVLITEAEQIDISKKRLDAGFSTLQMELKAIYPQLKREEIEKLEDEIKEDQAARQITVTAEIEDDEQQVA